MKHCTIYKSLDHKKAPNKADMKINNERMTLLMITNNTGSHKIKLPCINKVKLPGGSTCQHEISACSKMCNIFASWFESESVTARQEPCFYQEI
jgi:hypothetical protein